MTEANFFTKQSPQSRLGTNTDVSIAMAFDIGDNDDGDTGDLSSLFICEEYVEKEFTFPHPGGASSTVQRLLCSSMSSTAHDLTGQIVWPAAEYLSYFIEYVLSKNLTDAVVMELGAGCGLSGFLASRYCSKSIITDGSDVVVRLLEKNMEFLGSSNVEVSSLLWGMKIEINKIVDKNGAPPDVILGADVILWPNQIEFLLYTILWLLSFKPLESNAYIAYVVRATSTTDLLLATAERLNLSIIKLDDEMGRIFSGVEGGVAEPSNLASLQKHILNITIKKDFARDIKVPLSLVRESIDEELERNFYGNAAPC